MRQYVQLSVKNSQYKNSIQNFDFRKVQPQSQASLASLNTEPNTIAFSGVENLILPNVSRYSSEFVGEGFSDIKEIYEKMEFDAMRYNRNFDTQTGAEKL